jgi:beta-glucosidase
MVSGNTSSAMAITMETTATPHSFDVEEVLSKLDLSEKIALLSGVDFWHTAPVHRLGVPSIRLSDGPNGVRGIRYWKGVPAACLPCGMLLCFILSI